MKLTEKLVQAGRAMGNVPKTGRMFVDGQNRTYHSASDVVSAARNALADVGVLFTFSVTNYTVEPCLVGERQKPAFKAVVLATLEFASDGERLSVQAIGMGLDPTDKATGKATSYAIKDGLIKTFLLQGDTLIDNEALDAGDSQPSNSKSGTSKPGATTKKQPKATPPAKAPSSTFERCKKAAATLKAYKGADTGVENAIIELLDDWSQYEVLGTEDELRTWLDQATKLYLSYIKPLAPTPAV